MLVATSCLPTCASPPSSLSSIPLERASLCLPLLPLPTENFGLQVSETEAQPWAPQDLREGSGVSAI